MTLDYVALGIFIAVALIIFYGIIVIHDIPYEIAKKRNHPHQDAIHYAGWVSLFTLHVLWPLLWIWATLWREDRGWGIQQIAQEQHDIQHHVAQLNNQIDELRQEIAVLKTANNPHSQQEEQ
ncbi:DUF3302 domain-containing protein [Enterobacteriaceae bacterium BIT-l23]|uniref:DUF3302 domain-containing protein n=1 Tax=Jejubacter sp. L23 TaxID=3092086 RepID=UPI001584B31D|nr:DUF3302 domain-containing protein [Enterobacteriaceae bacterium BIT-l23]